MNNLISRQAAINELRKCRFVVDGIEKIRELPSAQPEPIKYNIEDFDKEDWERFKKEWRNAPITVLPAQPEIIRCKDCKWFNDIGCAIRIVDDTDKPSEEDYCSFAERRQDG